MKTENNTTADFLEHYKNTNKEQLKRLLKDMRGTMGTRMQAKKVALTILTSK